MFLLKPFYAENFKNNIFLYLLFLGITLYSSCDTCEVCNTVTTVTENGVITSTTTTSDFELCGKDVIDSREGTTSSTTELSNKTIVFSTTTSCN